MEREVKPIEPNAEQIKLTEDLEKYMMDNLDRIKQWHKVHGLGVRPPILYDVAKGIWFWASRARRRKITKQQGAQIEKDFSTILDPNGNPFERLRNGESITDPSEEGEKNGQAHSLDPGQSQGIVGEESSQERNDTKTDG